MSYETKLIREEIREVKEEYISNLVTTHNLSEAEATNFVTDLIESVSFIYEKH